MQRCRSSYYRNWARERATDTMNHAIRDGRLMKPKECGRCGRGGKIEGHHPDTSKPLEVRWLCEPCRKTVNIELRRKEVAQCQP